VQSARRLCRAGDEPSTETSTALIIIPDGYDVSDMDQDASLEPSVACLGETVEWARLPAIEYRRWMIDSLFDGVSREEFKSRLDGGFVPCDFCTLKKDNARRKAAARARRRPEGDDDTEEDNDGKSSRRWILPPPSSTPGRVTAAKASVVPLGRPSGGHAAGGRRQVAPKEFTSSSLGSRASSTMRAVGCPSAPGSTAPPDGDDLKDD